MARRTSRADQYVSLRLKEIRRKKQVSRQLLGKHLGISFQQVQKYESGVNRISAGRLFTIAKFLNVHITEFYRGLS